MSLTTNNSDSVVQVSFSQINGNTSEGNGGGLDIGTYHGGSVAIPNATISGNTAYGEGGGADLHGNAAFEAR